MSNWITEAAMNILLGLSKSSKKQIQPTNKWDVEGPVRFQSRPHPIRYMKPRSSDQEYSIFAAQISNALCFITGPNALCLRGEQEPSVAGNTRLSSLGSHHRYQMIKTHSVIGVQCLQLATKHR